MLVAIHTRTLRHWRLAYGTTDVPFGPTRTVYPFETCMAVAATSVHCNMTLLKLDVTVWTDRQTCDSWQDGLSECSCLTRVRAA